MFSNRSAVFVSGVVEKGFGDSLATGDGVGLATKIGGTQVFIQKHGFDCLHDRVMGVGVTQVIKHHRTGPDLTNRVCDTLAGNIRGRTMDRFEEGGEFAFRVDIARWRDADCARAGRAKVRQDIAKRFDATTTSKRSGFITNWAVRISIWYLSQVTSG